MQYLPVYFLYVNNDGNHVDRKQMTMESRFCCTNGPTSSVSLSDNMSHKALEAASGSLSLFAEGDLGIIGPGKAYDVPSIS